MKRRRVITLLTTSALASPFAVRAQQGAMPLIGYLGSTLPGPNANNVAGFRVGLKETGFVEGRNLAIEYRWAEGRYERLPAMARELVRRQVAVLVTTGGDVSAHAAKEATSSIPIVFLIGSDPVAGGLVTSFNRPGANLTGLAMLSGELAAKRLELIRAMVPVASVIATLLNPASASFHAESKDLGEGARRLGVRLLPLMARVEEDFEVAFATLSKQRADALLVSADAFFQVKRERLVALSARYKMPTIFGWREPVASGGLMSYGTSLVDMHRQVGVYTGRILKGAKPADLPVVQPTRFEMVVNAKTAKALGIRIPNEVLQRADELIE